MDGTINWRQSLQRLILALVLGLTFNVGLAKATQTMPLDEFAFAAPEECWIYTRWNEPFAYDANSESATERMMAEPEVKAFVDELVTRVGLMAPAFDTGEDEARTELLHKVGPQLANVIFKRNGCFFLESFDMSKDGEPKDVKAALVLDAGKNAASLARDIANVMNVKAIPSNGNDEPTYKTTLDSKLELVITTAEHRLFIATSQSAIAATKNAWQETRSRNGCKNSKAVEASNTFRT